MSHAAVEISDVIPNTQRIEVRALLETDQVFDTSGRVYGITKIERRAHDLKITRSDGYVDYLATVAVGAWSSTKPATLAIVARQTQEV